MYENDLHIIICNSNNIKIKKEMIKIILKKLS